MDVVVSSRHCEVSERFREHVEDKLTRLEKHDHRIIRVEVLLEKEKAPRQPERSVRVELTARSRGPVVRAEACAEDKMAALDLALDKMAAQMRRAADRRKVHRGQHRPQSVGQALGQLDPWEPADPSSPDGAADTLVADAPGHDGQDGQDGHGSVHVDGDGPLVVREKTHTGTPMTLDQALYEMELVGHDFYLYVDKASDRPCVVYRRRGYDYGVIALEVA